MLVNDEVYRVKNINKLINNITALFVFIMTCVVSFILSVAQSNDVNLNGKSLFIFIVGFGGSIICILIRYIFLYYIAIKPKSAAMRIFMILYLTIGSIIFISMLIIVLQLSNFSTDPSALAHYNAYQFFMLGVLIYQWLGERLFEK